jgi:hypothetical protein
VLGSWVDERECSVGTFGVVLCVQEVGDDVGYAVRGSSGCGWEGEGESESWEEEGKEREEGEHGGSLIEVNESGSGEGGLEDSWVGTRGRMCVVFEEGRLDYYIAVKVRYW